MPHQSKTNSRLDFSPDRLETLKLLANVDILALLVKNKQNNQATQRKLGQNSESKLLS